MKKVKYGLLQISTNQLLKVDVTDTSQGEFCNEQSFEILADPRSEQVWLVDDANKADFARLHGNQWYSSSYNFPMCKLDPKDLKVVEVTMSFKEVSLENNFYEKAVKKSIKEGSVHNQEVLDSYLKDKKKLSLKELKTKYPHPGPERIFK